jgi:16S rRNA (adenine1518-N6/adenine1519-N6)-dimethyltransferase
LSSEKTRGLEDLPSLSETIRLYDLAPKKSLGQNFLLDLNVTRKIARQALPFLPQETIIEVGSGPGGLTRALLLEGAPHVIALEKDQRCLQALQALKERVGERLKILEADALETSLANLGSGPFKIVANLPYNISTQLLIQWIEERSPTLQGMVLMFQKEVAERLVAKPRTKAYGRLSILTQLHFEAYIAFDLLPHHFKPAPKVTSSVVVFKPLASLLSQPLWHSVKHLTQLAFSQRRKMVRKLLGTVFAHPDDALSTIGASLTARAEELSPQQFVVLAQLYEEQRTC